MRTFLLLALMVMTAGEIGISLQKFQSPLWTKNRINHQPLVKRPGYPIVSKSIQDTKRITVLLSTDEFGGSDRGTGILIDKTHILTCYHMVTSFDQVLSVYPYPGSQVIKAHPVEGSRSQDVAILELEQPVYLPKYAVFNTTTSVGEPITVIGNMEGSMKWFVTYGVVSEYNDGFILTDALIRGGNSGGPWINDAGEIVGMTSFGYTMGGRETGMNGGVSAKTMTDFIQMWKFKNEMFVSSHELHPQPKVK